MIKEITQGDILTIKFETNSKLELRKVDLFNYFQDSSTVVYLASYSVNKKTAKSLWLNPENVDRLKRYLESDRIDTIKVFNYGFVDACLRKLGINTTAKIDCLQSRAKYYRIPFSLRNALLFTRIPSKERPHESTLENTIYHNGFFLPNSKTEAPKYTIEMIERYKKEDIRNLNALDEVLPILPEQEYQARDLTKRINDKGVCINMKLVTAISNAYKKSTVKMNSILKKADTILEKVSKTDEGYRLKNAFMYYGTLTGRWTSYGVQLMNMPKSHLKIEDIIAFQSGNNQNLTVDSSFLMGCLRSTLQATKGKDLFIADFSSVELLSLARLANDATLINELTSGQNIYINFCSLISNRDVSSISKKEPLYSTGKTAILAIIYGVGAISLHKTIKEKGLNVSLEECKNYIQVFKDKYEGISKLWAEASTALNKLIFHKEDSYQIMEDVTAYRVDNRLEIDIKGRRLFYHDVSFKTQQETGKIAYCYKSYNFNKTTGDSTSLYGSKLISNINQALARDYFLKGCLNVEKKGFEIVSMIHDEIVAEGSEDKSIEEFVDCMCSKSDLEGLQAVGKKSKFFN